MISISPPIVVLDTNVVLDWLLFDDPRVAAVAAAITAGGMRWVATGPMRAELAHVLTRGIASRRGHATTSIVDSFDRWASCEPPTGAAPLPGLHCSDRDDQKFIDLALHVGASALISRDRAVLKLGRRAQARGLRIVVPERWAPAQNA